MRAELGKWYLFAFVPLKKKLLGEVVGVKVDRYNTRYVMKVYKKYTYNAEDRQEVTTESSGTCSIRPHHILKEMSKSEVLLEMMD